jgi:hypothetical protein
MATRTASAGSTRDFARTLTHSERLARLDRIARVMDTAFAIPGTKIRLGADAVLGLAPGVGDIIAQAVSAYILYEAHRMGVPKYKLLRMGGNILMDLTFGAVPIAGDVFDVFWRSNIRNMKIVRDHIEKQGRK